MEPVLIEAARRLHQRLHALGKSSAHGFGPARRIGVGGLDQPGKGREHRLKHDERAPLLLPDALRSRAAIASSRLASAPAQAAFTAASSSATSPASNTPRMASRPSMVGGASPILTAAARAATAINSSAARSIAPRRSRPRAARTGWRSRSREPTPWRAECEALFPPDRMARACAAWMSEALRVDALELERPTPGSAASCDAS